MSDRVSRALEVLRRIAAPAAKLSPEERARLEKERIEANRARIAGVMPLLVVLQAATLVLLWPHPGSEHLAFRTGAAWIHGLSLPVVTLLSLAAWLGRRPGLRLSWLGDVVVVFVIGLGLTLSLNTHHLSQNVNALTVSLFACALIVRPTTPGGILAYGGALVGTIAGLRAVQPDADVRLAATASGVSAVVISGAFSRMLDLSFVRDIVQRMTIERQKAELVAWTAELERRVQAHVSEALAQADKVRALDAQLRWNVRDQSRKLARAVRTQAHAPQEGQPLSPGTPFEDRFGIERSIGEGAMGDVYAARDHASGQEVAIKVLRRSEDLAPEDIGRFVSEAAAAATVVHPAIVRTYHVDITDSGHFYLVMELVHGHTLAESLERGRFDAAQTARLGSVVAEALAAAHATGVIHRDIKPGNLMLTFAAPGVRVLDFGVSKLLDADAAEATVGGQVVGTPQYMAPEQIVRRGKLTGACDVYALGQVMYEMLVGEPCFTGKTVRDVLNAQVTEAPVSVRARAGAGAVPEDLSGLIAQCLEKAPEARPTADSLSAALRVIADSLGAPPLERIGAPRHPLPSGAEAGARGEAEGAHDAAITSPPSTHPDFKAPTLRARH